jgi:hypothetical protein
MIVTKNRKGISTFIATLLLMVLAISAGVVIYAYTMGYLGSFGGPTTMGAISIDTWALDINVNGTGLTAYIRNIGKTTFQLDKVYVNGILISNTTKPVFTNLAENAVGQLNIPYDDWKSKVPVWPTTVTVYGKYPWQGSTTYDIKIIGKDNTQLSFQVKK